MATAVLPAERVVRRLKAELELGRQEIRHGRFQRSMALIAAFSAVVSGFESYMQHQRGAFRHWLMWTPVWLTLPTMLASGAALLSERAARWLLPVVSLVSLADGVIGFGYHLRGIAKLPGGFRLGRYNLVMGPPVFAPLLTCSVGVIGLLAGFSRREVAGGTPATTDKLGSPGRALRGIAMANPLQRAQRDIAQGRFQQGMALTSAFFAILAGGEAYFEHLRGSFGQWEMWTPVWVTPPMVAAAIGAARSRQVAHRVLPFVSVITFLDGLIGFVLHLRGVKRMPGHFTNLRFNLTLGPPLFAPLLFCSVGLLGFIAALLRREGERP
jgi:hypothetical protein